MQAVILFGTSSIAPVIAEYLSESGQYEVVAHTEEYQYINQKNGKFVNTTPLETLHTLYSPETHVVHVLTSQRLGNPRQNKAAICKIVKAQGFRLMTFIDPEAFVATSAQIGENCFIAKGSMVEPLCVVGDGVHMRPNSYLSHGSSVGNYTFLAPRTAIAGKVTIGNYCFIGLNASIRDNVKIGDYAIIGAGAVIQKHVPDHSVVKAADSRILDRKSDSFQI